ncbi:hypothetical protein H4R33_005554 [Dimargaris cristalligena]|nr:hypothetical protein H4R33_005554 [Dimargaris cristalligena]
MSNHHSPASTNPIPREENPDLDAFRRKWQAEVRAKTHRKQSTDPGITPATSATTVAPSGGSGSGDILASAADHSKLPSTGSANSASQQLTPLATITATETAGHGSLAASSSTSVSTSAAGPANPWGSWTSSLSSKDHSALGLYSQAIAFEQEGQLGEALQCYQRAFRLHGHVDNLYRKVTQLKVTTNPATITTTAGPSSTKSMVHVGDGTKKVPSKLAQPNNSNSSKSRRPYTTGVAASSDDYVTPTPDHLASDLTNLKLDSSRTRPCPPPGFSGTGTKLRPGGGNGPSDGGERGHPEPETTSTSVEAPWDDQEDEVDYPPVTAALDNGDQVLDQGTGSNQPLPLPIEPLNPDQPCWIAELPRELQVIILRHLLVMDLASVSRFAQVCQTFRALTQETALWRWACEYVFSSPALEITDGAAKPSSGGIANDASDRRDRITRTAVDDEMQEGGSLTVGQLEAVRSDLNQRYLTAPYLDPITAPSPTRLGGPLASAYTATESILHGLDPDRFYALSHRFNSLVLDRRYRGNWCQLFRGQPRVRWDGVYVSTCYYARPGRTENTWYQPVHMVTYYRYMRFYRDGRCLKWLTTDEPKKAIKALKWDPLVGAAYHATYSDSTPVTNSIGMGMSTNGGSGGGGGGHGSLRSGEGIMSIGSRRKGLMYGTYAVSTQGQLWAVVCDPDRPTLTFFIHAQAKSSAQRGRHNKLNWLSYASMNLKYPDEVVTYSLTDFRPFYFSRVRSYGAVA